MADMGPALEALKEAILLEQNRFFPRGDPPHGIENYAYSVEQAGAKARIARWSDALSKADNPSP